MANYEPLIERFERKYIPEPNSGCWLWLAGIHFTRGGGPYGAIRNENGCRPVMESAHRASYKLHVGPIPDKMDIDHTCENTLCVNPDHLQVITHRRHSELTWGRIKKGFCKRGHAMLSENIWTSKKNGTKHCRPCFAARAREQKARAKMVCAEVFQ